MVITKRIIKVDANIVLLMVDDIYNCIFMKQKISVIY